MNIFCW